MLLPTKHNNYGWKGFREYQDVAGGKRLFCRDYWFKQDGEWNRLPPPHNIRPVHLCINGFHFCKELWQVFDYYDAKPEKGITHRFYLIEYSGSTDGDERDKMCARAIRLVREATWVEMLVARLTHFYK